MKARNEKDLVLVGIGFSNSAQGSLPHQRLHDHFFCSRARLGYFKMDIKLQGDAWTAFKSTFSNKDYFLAACLMKVE